MKDEIEFKNRKYSRFKEKREPQVNMVIYVYENYKLNDLYQIILLSSFGVWCFLPGSLKALKLLDVSLVLILSVSELIITMFMWCLISMNVETYKYKEVD